MSANNNNKKNDKAKKTIIQGIASIICIIITITMFIGPVVGKEKKDTEKTYNEFIEYVKKKKVDSIDYDSSHDSFEFKLKKDDTVYEAPNPRSDTFKKEMLEKDITVNEVDFSGGFLSTLGSLFFLIIQYGLMLGMFLFLFKKMQGNTDEMSIETSSTKKFEDVAGLEEVKDSLLTTVDMLKNPKKYEDAEIK